MPVPKPLIPENSWSFMAIHVQKLKFYEGEEYMEGAHW